MKQGISVLMLCLIWITQIKAQETLFTETFSDIKALQVSSQGFVFVLDGGRSVLSKYSLDGSFEYSVGSRGFGLNRFDTPNHLFLGAGLKLLVTDSGNQRVAQYDRNLQFLGEITEKSARNLNGWSPVQSVSLATGEIWVLDTYTQQLFLFDENGLFRLSVYLPDTIQVNEKTKMFVTQSGLQLVQPETFLTFQFSVLGKYEGFIKMDLEADWFGYSDNYLMIVKENTLAFWDAKGKDLMKEIDITYLSGEIRAIQLTQTGVYIATQNRVYFYLI
jgi:hypothetical protein